MGHADTIHTTTPLLAAMLSFKTCFQIGDPDSHYTASLNSKLSFLPRAPPPQTAPTVLARSRTLSDLVLGPTSGHSGPSSNGRASKYDVL
uniref:Uncharacterized protein n=1 Tax=Physcomitrium patens TaxID=3218 RepID=A0A2K1JN04_PHYPA|nr:hypothetical protein PHYPA_017750 [Physcomitrium patens]